MEALAEERIKAVDMAKALEEVAMDRMELSGQHYEEIERAKMALNKVQTTYQTQLLEYERQVQATAGLIKKLKEERQVAEDKSKMGLNWIREIVLTWKEQTKTMIEENSIEWWSKWAQQAM